MDEDRRLILSLVEEGKITPEEAAALLQALDELDGEELPPAGSASEGGGTQPKQAPNPGAEADGRRAPAGSWDEHHGAPPEHGTFGPGPWLDRLPGFDPEELARTLEGVMGRLGDELRHLPQQLARLGFAPGEHRRITTVASRPWTALAGPIAVDNARGDVDLETWDQDEVEVRADIRLGGQLDDETRHWVEAEGLRLEEAGGSLRIVVRDPARELQRGPRLTGADLRLRVPASAVVRVRTAHGDVSLSGELKGSEVTVASGDITVAGGSGNLRLSSRSGDVQVNGFQGESLELNSASGDLQASGTAASVRLHTASGDVRLDLAGCREVRAVSVSGDVEGELRLDAGARCDLQSTSGDLQLTLAAAGLQVSLESLSGDLDCLLPLDRVQRSKRIFTGSRGDGAARVSAKTLSGDVTLR
ncbi:MAG: DUF4097 family beta strand repeat-containing protein [Symbiobacteriia bacterium]